MPKIKQVSHDLVEELATLIGCPKDYLTLECMHTTFIYDGKEVDAPAIVEVAWFDRGQEVQDAVAQCITKYLGEGLPCFEVYFITLKENQYYENGQHF